MTATPWGKSDDSRRLAKGITFYGTPSHGGIRVTERAALEALSPAALQEAEVWSGAYWFEEDVACFIVFNEVEKVRPSVYSKEDCEKHLETSYGTYLERVKADYTGPAIGEKYVTAGDLSFGSGRSIPKGTEVALCGYNKLRPLFRTEGGFLFTASFGAMEK